MFVCNIVIFPFAVCVVLSRNNKCELIVSNVWLIVFTLVSTFVDKLDMDELIELTDVVILLFNSWIFLNSTI